MLASQVVADSRAAFQAVWARKPLVHNITNMVVMNVTANALLAIGASPAMVHAKEEVGDFVRLAAALVINLGTLSPYGLEGMILAVEGAQQAGIPWVLDPVGVGATGLRNSAAARLATLRPSVIRANPAEIIALAELLGFAGGKSGGQQGVDSLLGGEEALDAGKYLASKTASAVAVTGAVDYVITEADVRTITGGHPMSQLVTGTGCMATALIGACLAVAPPENAALAGLALMKAAAEHAANGDAAPGTFAIRLLDFLHVLSRDTLGAMA